MTRAYDIEIAEVGFIALAPQDARFLRRGGVVIWAETRSGRFRLLSVQEAPMISLSAGLRPPDADTLFVSPPITDNRRRREVCRAVRESGWRSVSGWA